jgi:hypothetical protein
LLKFQQLVTCRFYIFCAFSPTRIAEANPKGNNGSLWRSSVAKLTLISIRNSTVSALQGKPKMKSAVRELRVIAVRDVEIQPGVILHAGVYPGRAIPMGNGIEYRVRMTAEQLAKAGARANLFAREFTITSFVHSGEISLQV